MLKTEYYESFLFECPSPSARLASRLSSQRALRALQTVTQWHRDYKRCVSVPKMIVVWKTWHCPNVSFSRKGYCIFGVFLSALFLYSYSQRANEIKRNGNNWFTILNFYSEKKSNLYYCIEGNCSKMTELIICDCVINNLMMKYRKIQTGKTTGNTGNKRSQKTKTQTQSRPP